MYVRLNEVPFFYLKKKNEEWNFQKDHILFSLLSTHSIHVGVLRAYTRACKPVTYTCKRTFRCMKVVPFSQIHSPCRVISFHLLRNCEDASKLFRIFYYLQLYSTLCTVHTLQLRTMKENKGLPPPSFSPLFNLTLALALLTIQTHPSPQLLSSIIS